VLAEAVTIRDPDGDIVYANRAALTSMGFGSLAELRSRTSVSIMDEYLVEDEHGQPLSMQDVPSVRMMHGKSAPPLLMRTVHKATGVEVWRLLKTTAMRDERGQFLGAITVIEDVSPVKAAEVHTRVLAESGRILASSLDYQQTLGNVADVAVPSIADYCGVDLLDDKGRLERVAAAHRSPAKQEIAAGLRNLAPTYPQPGNPATRVLETGASELFPEVTDAQLVAAARSEEHLALLRGLDIRSLLMVPMRVPSHTIGLLTLATAESRRRLSDADVELAEQLGRRAAVAVENSRLHTKLAGVAETLQQSLLPDEVPEIPGWEAASLYRPAQAEQRIDVGGDFYEFFEHDGTWFAIVGDVTGKGVTAASMTALMRHGARVASRLEPHPSAILSRLDEALKLSSRQSLCTALCLSLHDDHVVISSAGHPPALVVQRDGTVRQAPTPGPLLGAFEDAEWHEETVPVAPGEVLVLYTDGVVESPGELDRFGEQRLQALLADHAGQAPSELLAHLDAALEAFRSGPERDDVAAVALRALGPTAPP
jgi:serine phosphatase RsbU (regulator of sigma subunit)